MSSIMENIQATTNLTLLQTNVSDIRFVAFDTETTGVSYERDSIIEIAGLVFDEDFEQRRFSCLINPGVPIPKGATQIHGITDEMVAGAVRAPEGLKQFFSFLEFSGSPRVGLAHNASFDIGMILGECRRHSEINFMPEVVIDTCMLAKALLPQLEHHRLIDLVEHFKIKTDGFHRAMQDVVALKEVFLNLLSLASDLAPTTEKGFLFSSLIDLTGGYFLLQKKSKTKGQKGLGSFFFLPPRLEHLEELCGTDHQIGISYETEEDYRYITPVSLKLRSFRVYMEAFCHRDQMKKTFRLDKILKVGKVLSLFFFAVLFFFLTPNQSNAEDLSCQGRFGDPECRSEMYFSGCKQKLEVEWTAATMKPSANWIEKNKNHCKVTLTSRNYKTQLMLDPASCLNLFRSIDRATKVFPETDWYSHPCRSSTTVVETSKTALILRQEHKEAKAVEIEELLKCDLTLKSVRTKHHELECPVLLYSVVNWLGPVLKILNTSLVIQNKLR